VSEFSKHGINKDGLRSHCRICDKSRIKYSVNPNLKEKICTKCKKTKPVTEFSKDKTKSSGLKSECKVCQSKYQKSRNFSIDLNLKEKECGQCHKIKSVTEFCKNKKMSDGLNYICKFCQSKIEKTNRDKINERRKERYKTDPKSKLRVCIRSNMRRLVQGVQIKKTKKSLKYLSCTIDEFKKHIESQFVEGMSWENYGNPNGDHTKCWHMDHIIPLSYFIENSEDPFRANNYRNQRPMWSKENISKGDTLDMELIKEYGIEDLLPKKLTWQEKGYKDPALDLLYIKLNVLLLRDMSNKFLDQEVKSNIRHIQQNPRELAYEQDIHRGYCGER
tara:strand:- start:4798 stop:5796 length:999 start_codon:yes stop_codon:yes gene_type:complete